MKNPPSYCLERPSIRRHRCARGPVRFGGDAADMVGLETYSPLQDKDLCDYKIFDGGDLELPFGDPTAALA